MAGDLPIEAAWGDAVGASSEFLTFVDDDWKIRFFNRAVDGVVGESVFGFVSSEYHEAMRQAVARAHETGLPQCYQSEAANADGTAFYSNWVLSIVAGEERLVAIIGIDVTHLHRVQRALDTSRETLRAVTEHAPDFITLINERHEVEFVSRTLSLPQEEVLGREVESFCAEADRDMIRGTIDHVFATGEQGHYETTIEHPNGTMVVSTRLGPVMHEGTVANVVLISTDITDSRALEREHERLAGQLFQAQKMEALGKLTGGIAHDFNNLLTVVTASVEMLRFDRSHERVEEVVEQVLEVSRRGSALTRHLLAFARRETLVPKPCDVGELLAVEKPILERALGASVEVELDVPDGLWPCLVDAGHLQGALLNLAINGRDAMNGKGRLRIAAANVQVLEEGQAGVPKGDWVKLAVSDAGRGMDQETRARAAEPFYTTKGTEGSGLGLSMVYGFARQSEGHLEIDSEPGKGTTVSVFLPRHQGDGASQGPAAAARAEPGAQGHLVLLVEDDPFVRRATAALIRRLGYRVTGVERAEEALEVLAQHEDVALVVSDVVLPGELDGVALRRRVREAFPELPVILTSGYTAELLSKDEVDAELIFLSKPFTRAELAAAIERAMAPRGQ